MNLSPKNAAQLTALLEPSVVGEIIELKATRLVKNLPGTVKLLVALAEPNYWIVHLLWHGIRVRDFSLERTTNGTTLEEL